MRKIFSVLLITLMIFSVGLTCVMAQYGIPEVPQPADSSASKQEPDQQQTSVPKKDEFKGFSGKTSIYTNNEGLYKISVPEEFKMNSEGFTTDWTGPLINEAAASFSVNYVDMPGVSSDTLYAINLKSYKEKKHEYTDILPIKVKWGKKTAPAFRVKEVDYLRGMAKNKKQPNDIHRWHLFVFGNGKSYTLGFSCCFSAFTENKVQKMFEDVIKSFELI